MKILYLLWNNYYLTKKLRLLLEFSKEKRPTTIDGKLVYSSAFDFYIETDEAIYFENEDGLSHSYTFAIMRSESTTKLENLVLYLQEDGSYAMKIVTYNYTEQDRLDQANGLYVDLTDKVSYQSINDEGVITSIFSLDIACITILVSNCSYSNSDHDGGYDGAHQCPGHTETESVQIGDCGGGSGGYGGAPAGYTGTSDPSGTTYSDTGNTYGGGSGIGTSPIEPPEEISIEEKIEMCFNSISETNSALIVLDTLQSTWLFDGFGVRYKDDVINFLEANFCSDEARQFVKDAIDVLMDTTNNINTFEEFIELKLNEELLITPTLLLDIDCSQIANWQTLAQHVAPVSVQQKINALPTGTFNNFEIQSLTGAGGTMVNMDYFPVNITTLPNNPSTGNQFTADEFLDYFRRNLTAFANGVFPFDSEFYPYCEIPSICTQETNLWNSNNPLGALIYIDIPADDGVVICTEFNNDYWYFQTMNAPVAGNHPVSGTRQFGYELNANGSYNFFVRGVDRFDLNTAENVSYMANSLLGLTTTPNPFFAADALWEKFQENINNFVNNNGGTSTELTPVKNRPDWDKVKDVLEGKKPISDLGCN